MVIISLFQLISKCFVDPAHLWNAIQLKRKKAIQLFLLLSAVIAIPFFTEGIRSIQLIARDAQVVADRIPAFEITNGELQFEEPFDKALVVKTDAITVIMDPNNQYDDRQEESDTSNNGVNILFKDNHFTFLSAQVPISITYDNAEGLNHTFFKDLLLRFSSVNVFTILTVVFVSLLTGLIEAAVRYLTFTLGANILSLLTRVRLPFWENWKLMMVASAVPTLIFAILNGFQLYPPGQLMLLLFISLYLYYQGIKAHIKK